MELLKPQKVVLKPSEKKLSIEMSVVSFPMDKAIPKSTSLRWLLDFLKITDKTLVNYREIAFECIGAYKTAALRRNSDWHQKIGLQGFEIEHLRKKYAKLPADVKEKLISSAIKKQKKYRPDKPPFSQTETLILIKIHDLYRNYRRYRITKNRASIVDYIKSNKNFWRHDDGNFQVSKNNNNRKRA